MRVLFGAVLATIALAGCDDASDTTASRAPQASTAVASPSQQDFAKQNRASDERAFIAAVEHGKAEYEAADNDMMKGGARGRRKVAICNALTGTSISRWSGVISDLGSNSEGKGTLTVDLGNGIQLATFNNGLSDGLKDSHTLIDSSTPLFASVAHLKKGDAIQLSGELFSDDTDCVEELSAFSLQESMATPKFLVRFESVKKL